MVNLNAADHLLYQQYLNSAKTNMNQAPNLPPAGPVQRPSSASQTTSKSTKNQLNAANLALSSQNQLTTSTAQGLQGV